VLRRSGLAVVAAALALATSACGSSKPSKGAQANRVNQGAALFAANCAACHGPDATGGTAPTLNSKQFLTTADDLTIKNTVRVGLAGTAMRSWGKDLGGPFDDKQIAAIVAYLRSLEPTAPDAPNWRQGKAGGGTSTSTSISSTSTSSTATP
jgi:mono/diheme cytochrome c family protein